MLNFLRASQPAGAQCCSLTKGDQVTYRGFGPADLSAWNAVARHTIEVDGLRTRYYEAGRGPAVVLLHGGEFGAAAQLTWQHTLPALATAHRVLAPDWLGYGGSAKLFDFDDMYARRMSHLRAFCTAVGVQEADFVGASMGALNLLRDGMSPTPLLPARTMTVISGGGAVPQNQHRQALTDYDGSRAGMRAIVKALFHDSRWHDDDHVQRRYESSHLPGAWSSVAAARFRAPRTPVPQRSPESAEPDYSTVTVPTLVIAGMQDKLKDAGYGKHLKAALSGAPSNLLEVPDTGHYPQLEQPAEVNPVLLDFLGR
jgi:pimeloyl-ACP methyl ester carboxylesterase